MIFATSIDTSIRWLIDLFPHAASTVIMICNRLHENDNWFPAYGATDQNR